MVRVVFETRIAVVDVDVDVVVVIVDGGRRSPKRGVDQQLFDGAGISRRRGRGRGMGRRLGLSIPEEGHDFGSSFSSSGSRFKGHVEGP